MPTMGELCAGGGMLTRALENLFGVTSVWHAETDEAASKVLGHHWPDAPNLGDITNLAWNTLDPVDLLAAGFPCQPFSAAGKRGGSADERHLWPTGVLPGIEALMPPVVVLENVPNLLTIESGRVFGQVLADLDRLGYITAWTVVGACKVGACHHRHRLFVLAVRDDDVAVPATDPVAARRGDVWLPTQQVLFGDADAVKWPASGVVRAGLMWPLPVETCGDNGVVLLPTPRVSATRTGRSAIVGSASSPSLEHTLELARGEVPRELRSLDEAPESWQLLPTPTASLGRSTGFPSRQTSQERMGAGKRFLDAALALLPTPVASDGTGGPDYAMTAQGSPDLRTVVTMFPTPTARDARRGAGRPFTEGRPLSEVVALLPSQLGQFGKYELAVRRHESAFNLPVPAPVEPNRRGNPRLTAAFPEWMMGLPAGYITDVVDRADALRIAGNGVFGPTVLHALPTVPTFPAAVRLLAASPVGVAA